MSVKTRSGLFVAILMGIAALLASPAKAGVITQTSEFTGTIAYAGPGVAPLTNSFLLTSLPPTFEKFNKGLGTLDSVTIEITFDLSLKAKSFALGLFPFPGFNQQLVLSPSTLYFSFGGFPLIAYSLPSRTGSCTGTVSCTAVLSPLVVPGGSVTQVFPAIGSPGTFNISHFGTLTSLVSGSGLPGLISGRSNIRGAIDVSYVYTSLESGGGSGSGSDSVPEPGPLGILVIGFAGLGVARRRRHSTQTRPH